MFEGHNRFKSSAQQSAASAICLDHRDGLISLPTGGGKSLCYQLPAIALPGLAIVISPLLALIDDQLAHLKAQHIPAATLNSSQLQGERASVLQAMGRTPPDLKLLYLTPEQVRRLSYRAP